MLKSTKSQTIVGGSWITTNDVSVQVASMYASLDSKGNRSENVSIINQKLYEENREVVEIDIEEFTKLANELTNDQ